MAPKYELRTEFLKQFTLAIINRHRKKISKENYKENIFAIEKTEFANLPTLNEESDEFGNLPTLNEESDEFDGETETLQKSHTSQKISEKESKEEKYEKPHITLHKHEKKEGKKDTYVSVKGSHVKLPYHVMRSKMHAPVRRRLQRKPIQKPQRQLAKPAPPLLIRSMLKIERILNDQMVTSIECPGPNIPINVSTGGFSKSTPIRFSEEEIDKIMSEVSQKTKIPVNPKGIFKAVIGNLIIISIASEHVGTRFIVQKRAPSQQQRK